MEVVTALKAIRRRWLIVAILTGAMAALAGGLTAISTPTFVATAQGLVSVSSPQSRPEYSLAYGSQYILNRMTSYAQLGVTTPVLEPVVNELNLPETPVTLSDQVVSESIVNSALLEVSVKYDDPVVAARIADATLAHLGQTIETLEDGNVTVTAVGPAVVPSAPSNRNLAVNCGVGAGAGLIVGLFLAVGLAEIRSRRAARAPSVDVTAAT